jgi:hypothetical protein
MANRLVLVISDTNATIQHLIDKSFKDSAGTAPSLNKIANYLLSVDCGAQTGATVQVTVRDTAPSVTTSGSGSVQATISKL